MKNLTYHVYMAYSNSKYRIFMSPSPTQDLKYLQTEGYKQGLLLSTTLPLGHAFFLWQQIADAAEEKGKVLEQRGYFFERLLGKSPRSINKIIRIKSRQAQKVMAEWGIKDFSASPIMATGSEQKELLWSDSETLLKLLAGRILLPSEIEKLFLEHQLNVPKDLWSQLQVSWLQGKVNIMPAVAKRKDGYQCNRCGQKEKLVTVECVRCGNDCIICEECIAMGEARSCLPLIAVEESSNRGFNPGNYQPQLKFSLTPAQRDAYQQVSRFFIGPKHTSDTSLANKIAGEVKEKEKLTCLVWAVCGAGKTEVSFGAIAEALNNGGQVLFAIPRRDVVMELEPRLQQAFPGVKITSIYGGSEDKFQESQITIATTHQAIRFYKRFSLIVLDEADAYPYRGSEMLYHFVQRAKHPAGKIVYMTATPSKALLAQLKQGEMQQVTIPARHHGVPLPEPQYLEAPRLKLNVPAEIKMPTEVFRWLHKVVEGDKGQVFIFVPTIKLAETAAVTLSEGLKEPPFSFPEHWVQFSHSKDPKRDDKRKQFKEGIFPLFVTTSIMERGITVSRAKVLVLFADYERIFDQGTLVQMAGRSGRLDADPVGEVLFVATKMTPSMKGAIEAIKAMNEEARKKGYLHAE